MSTLRVIEKAVRTLPKGEQRELLAFVATLVNTSGDEQVNKADLSLSLESVHPELRPVVGIIPEHADADEVHLYRLLKHA
jgi:hypothetical protein